MKALNVILLAGGLVVLFGTVGSLLSGDLLLVPVLMVLGKYLILRSRGGIFWLSPVMGRKWGYGGSM